MIKRTTVLSLAVLMVLAACASSGSGKTEETGASERTGLSLQEAIEQSAEKIAADLPAGSRVVIVTFESPNDNLSDYIMEELSGALVDSKIEVADRKNLEYVYRELNFQMSGDVSDESAQSIGKFLGAQMVIVGQLTDVGGSYRFRTSAILVEKATRASIPRFDVRNDRAMQNMVTAFGGQQNRVKTTAYGTGADVTPQSAGTFLDRGIMFAGRGEYAKAIADFTQAITIDPKLGAAYLLRGRALYAGGSTGVIVQGNFSTIIVDSTGGNATAEQAGVFDQAIMDYTAAIRLDPNNAVMYKERGTAYIEKGDNDLAIADLTQALKLNPNYPNAYNNRGNAYSNKGDYDQAIADYTQTIRIAPGFAVAYYNRGNGYFNKGDYDRAIADYTQTIHIAPDFADAYYNRGNAYFNKGDYDRAIADYEAELRLNPNHTYAKTNLQDARRQRGY
ncbi:MAG: tetratricopeptide repeat protein [Treponema sp.]|jgi:tetratricopeptide (TPR) repeat protein|nr:tetratricopeptide repeat protein [Treponema sp.]